MSYESPITKYVDRMVKDIVEKEDGYLMEEIRRVGFNIDKDELAKALEYDRGQYERGFLDGKLYRPPIVTNADRIRGMSDEELAGWFDRLTGGCDLCPIRRDCELGVESFGRCDDKWLAWLKSPVEVNNG